MTQRRAAKFYFLSMKRISLLALVFLALAAIAHAITVGTYNVENYLVTDRMADGAFRKAYPKPETEKAALRQAIAGFAPDILALQEMGKPEFLAELQRDLKADGLDYPHAFVLEAGDSDRHVAVLSKLPFKALHKHTQVPIKLFGKDDIVKRGVLEAVFATNEGDVSVFVIHLKSRRTERPDDPEGATQRSAEATAARDLVLSRYPDPANAKFIITGDWNDTRTSRAVRALQKRGELDVGEILRAYDSRGDTWTHAYRREDSYSRIDYILVSPGLKPFLERANAKIYDGAGVREASDHRPVYIKLKLEPAK